MTISEYKNIMCQNCKCKGENITKTRLTRNDYEKECTTLQCTNYKQK